MFKNKNPIDVTKLKNWDKNPRSIKADDFQRLKNQIKELGLYKPFIITEDGTVLGGNMRLRACKELGITKVPVTVVDAPTDELKLKYALSDNDRAGYYDEQQLAELILSIPDVKLGDYKVDLGKLTSIDDLLAQFGPEPVEDEVPELSDEPAVSKLGEVYQLGRHLVMCGDSTKIEDVEKLMGGKKADMVFTDPPYGVSYASKNEYLNTIAPGNRIQTPIENDHMDLEDTSEFIYQAFVNIRMILAKKSSYYITAPQGGDLMMMMMMMMQKAGIPLRHCLIWVKNNHVLGRTDYNYKHEPILYGWVDTHEFYGNGKFQFSTWEIDKPLKNDLHPTMKPVSLMVNAIENSTKPDQIVTDIFLGSGSTLIACEQTNRTCFGCEIDNKYVDVIIKRWMRFTGKRAYKIIDADGKPCNTPVVFADESFMDGKTLRENTEAKSEEFPNTAQKNVGQSEPQLQTNA